ncbi:MAG: hypothetical protein M1587_11345 [Thaumarchaeota archaeon]|nr:hypothetical protein [Nitrososphaerota archaeon]
MSDDWQPSTREARWLRTVVDSMRIGAVWVAPIGFVFEKTGESELTLLASAGTDAAEETIQRTKRTAALAGIAIVDAREGLR